MKKIVLTYGDLNGIGPEVLIKALNELELPLKDVVIAGSQKVFDFYAEKYNLVLSKNYEIVDVPVLDGAFEVGHENAKSGEHCFQCLKKACELVNDGKVKNIVTATVSKHVLNIAGYNFSGQTEILEHFLAADNEKSEMLFVAGDFKIMLITRHMALKSVPSVLSCEFLKEKLDRLVCSLKNDFKIENPKIGVLALNPHAGENGMLGGEEKNIIEPLIKNYDKAEIFGPLVADAEFAEFGRRYFAGAAQKYDCYAAMYHDQGLIPMKMLAGDKAVNTTIGLKTIRTSPSHGTAFDIAGKNIARAESMKAAIELALKLS